MGSIHGADGSRIELPDGVLTDTLKLPPYVKPDNRRLAELAEREAAQGRYTAIPIAASIMDCGAVGGVKPRQLLSTEHDLNDVTHLGVGVSISAITATVVCIGCKLRRYIQAKISPQFQRRDTFGFLP